MVFEKPLARYSDLPNHAATDFFNMVIVKVNKLVWFVRINQSLLSVNV